MGTLGDLDKALETVKTIKLSGGIFGKTTHLLMVLCICVAAVCFQIGIWWFALILMFFLMAIITYALKRCMDFAEKNPYAAIMDGAELLNHERIMHGKKGQEELPSLPPVVDHQPPSRLYEELDATDPLPLPLPDATVPSEEEDKNA